MDGKRIVSIDRGIPDKDYSSISIIEIPSVVTKNATIGYSHTQGFDELGYATPKYEIIPLKKADIVKMMLIRQYYHILNKHCK